MSEPADGPGRIAAAFGAASDEGRAALMPYMMGGFPDPEGSLEIARGYIEGGADLIELGVPFSDPLADGPVIHEAATQALAAGTRLEDVLGIASEIGDEVPVVLMTYTNMILSGGGPEEFGRRAAAAGVSGVIVPDLPLGIDEEIRAAVSASGLAVVPLVAPTTAAARRRAICEVARGFVYVVSDVGTTGERGALPNHLSELVEEVRSEAEVPVAVGFGIGTPEQVAEVGVMADGVIVGSRLVRIATEAGDPVSAATGVREFLEAARESLAGSTPTGA